MVDEMVDVVVEVRTSSPKTAISLPEDAKKKAGKVDDTVSSGYKRRPTASNKHGDEVESATRRAWGRTELRNPGYVCFLMRLYRALRGCSCGSRGFLEDRMMDIITGRAPPRLDAASTRTINPRYPRRKNKLLLGGLSLFNEAFTLDSPL